MGQEKIIFDSGDISRMLTRMAYEIVEAHKGTKGIAFIGIQTRGIYLAQRLKTAIEAIDPQAEIPIGEIDITFYRDDWTRISRQPIVKPTTIPFAVEGRQILLVDDVLFTGRTTRAAIDAVLDFGRPARIELAVLADRGHREFPIQPDYTGKFIKTHRDETVNVNLKEHDGHDSISISHRDQETS